MVPDRFPCVDLSVVVPVRGEEEDVKRLHADISEALKPLGIEWEIVYVDDGARNGTPKTLAELARSASQVQVVTLDQHYGLPHALTAGVEATFGDWVAILDGEGRNDPADLPTVWEAVLRRAAEGVTDIRASTRILPRKVVRGLLRRGVLPATVSSTASGPIRESRISRNGSTGYQ